MATGMFGANTDELRAVAGEFARSGVETAAIGTKTTLAVETCMWWGPDAIAYKVNFAASIAPKFVELAAHLEDRALRLVDQAGAQDVCSDGTGSGGLLGAIMRGLGRFAAGVSSFASDAWKFFKSIGDFTSLSRFGLEAATALAGKLGFVDDVPRLTVIGEKAAGLFKSGSLGKGVAALAENWNGIDDLQEFVKGQPYLGRAYEQLGNLGDLTEFKPLSEILEHKLPSGVVDKAANFLGGKGELLGKGVGAFGVASDSWSTVEHLSEGEYKSAAWSGTKAALGAASFVPGPIGWAAAGVSAGMAVYEHREAIGNALTKAVHWVGGLFD